MSNKQVQGSEIIGENSTQSGNTGKILLYCEKGKGEGREGEKIDSLMM